jgi:hypothetical protein
VGWLAAGLEGLDDDHATTAAGARVRERLRRIGVARLLDRRRGQVQELTHGLHRFGAIGAGEQAIVTDAMETLGEDVGEEAADELDHRRNMVVSLEVV